MLKQLEKLASVDVEVDLVLRLHKDIELGADSALPLKVRRPVVFKGMGPANEPTKLIIGQEVLTTKLLDL